MIDPALFNPLNIRRTAIAWNGEDRTWTGPYCRFTSPEYCYRAAALILHEYETVRGIHTIGDVTLPDGAVKRGAISTWAPPEDGNPTAQYIANVCAWTGIDPQTPTELVTVPILRAMTRQESGLQADGSALYPDSIIDMGIILATPD